MENKLRRQSDIDSLVSELAAKGTAVPEPERATPPTAPPVQTARIKHEDASSLPNVKEISLRDALMKKQDERESREPTAPPGENLAERLRRVEGKIQKLEQMEKVRSGGGVNLSSNQQFQVIVKLLQQLRQDVSGMQAKLQGTPDYDIFHTFQCGKCGARERVAAVFRCTNCGHESWRGW